MPVRVLVVDDSVFFQTRLEDIISRHVELEVVGIASNGKEACEKVKLLKPDIVTMDFEMPVMDGISAIKIIMAENPTPILMFSSLSYQGARVTLDALSAGALDFIPKDYAEVTREENNLKERLHERLLSLAKNNRIASFKQAEILPFNKSDAKKINDLENQVKHTRSMGLSREKRLVVKKARPKIIVIGASTGGPVALTEILAKLPANFSVPLLLVQHMPKNFTKAFSERLNKLSNIEVKEAEHGDKVRPGLALVAPGGQQIVLNKLGIGSVKIVADSGRAYYKPSIDVTFASAANVYGSGVLAIVLTGMGSDGCSGAELLKDQGSKIWSQSEESCIVYGMPMSVVKKKLSNRVVALSDLSRALIQEVM